VPLLEGFRGVETGRQRLTELGEAAASKANMPVDLDSVGAHTLLVRADLHREGLVFPSSLVHHTVRGGTPAKRMRLVLAGMQNGTLRPYSAAIKGILISARFQQWLAGAPHGAAPQPTETNGMRLVLAGMQNRTLCPYLTAMNRILVPVRPAHGCRMRVWI
jgi:Anp1